MCKVVRTFPVTFPGHVPSNVSHNACQPITPISNIYHAVVNNGPLEEHLSLMMRKAALHFSIYSKTALFFNAV